MIAYKFLDQGAIAPFARVRWPAHAWLPGVHACDAAQLPWWLGDELWRVELSGSIVRGEHQLAAAKGRLLERIDGWPQIAAAFCERCIERIAALGPSAEGYLRDAKRAARAPAVCAYVAANAAAMAGGEPGHDAERRAQAQWLIDALRL